MAATQPVASSRAEEISLERHVPPPSLEALRRERVVRGLAADLHHDTIWLVPVRGFIGLGWLRAAAEKLSDPGWLDGASLTAFLSGQLAAGRVVLPLYQALIAELFLPNVVGLSWVILLGQLLAGFAILAGYLTSAGLLGGIFMNVNFLLVGVPNPSAFYLVIQGALLLSRAGECWGVDGWLSPQRPAPGSYVQARRPWRHRGALLLLAAMLLGVAASAVPFIRDISPAGSVEDPAVIVVVLASVGSMWTGLAWLRRSVPAPDGNVADTSDSTHSSPRGA